MGRVPDHTERGRVLRGHHMTAALLVSLLIVALVVWEARSE